MTDAAAELARFMGGELDPAAFRHREHVGMGYEMLRRYDFAAAYHFSCGLHAMAARAGRPEALHQTTTIAFLSLIAERLALRDAPADFTAFERANPDLMDKSVLAHWYRPERLALAAARRTFLLP